MTSYSGIQIQQQYAKVGYYSEKEQQTIRQPRATFELTTNPSKLDIQSPRGELVIDQRKAWDALGSNSAAQFSERVASNARNLALEGIGRTVEKGNRLAAIHLNANPIAAMAREEVFRTYSFNYFGPASYDNVDISYTAHKPNIQVVDGEVNLRAQENKPEINFNRGKLHYQMLQHAKVTITPPEIDVRM